MNFKQWMEMPIRSFNLVGKWDKEKDKPPGPKKRKMGYYGDDFGILTNQAAQEKIKKKWGRVEQDFDLYFVRGPGATKLVFTGEVNPEQLAQYNLGNIKPDPEAITLIFTNNTGANRIPMNWWAIAHRFGHALARSRNRGWEYFTATFDRHMFQLLKEVYQYQRQSGYSNDSTFSRVGGNEKMLRNLAMMIGTMKSCRERKLDRYFEFHYELLAQYMINGKVTFNPPTKLVVGHAWGKPQHRYGDPNEREQWAEHLVDNVAAEVNNDLDHTLNQCVGKTFII